MSMTHKSPPGRSANRKYTPAVARPWLFLIAGMLWSGMGMALCIVALSWLSHADWPESGWLAGAGFGLGALVYRFGFSGIARKNLSRITQKPEKVCLFAFQAWRSYLLIIIMASLGFALRQSHLSRLALATIYLAVGSGLALSSVLYYREIM